MKTQSGLLIVTLTKVELITLIKVLRAFECFIECVLGDLFCFDGVEFFSVAEFNLFGVVQDDALFADFGEEVLALLEFEIDEIDFTGDDADERAQVHFGEFGFDFVPKAGVSGGVAEAGNDEYVVVTSFADGQSASALLVRAVDPVSAGIRAEEEYHFSLWYDFADFFGDEH